MDLTTVVSQGPWAALCVFLLYRIFKKNDAQEKTYLELIEKSTQVNFKLEELTTMTLEVIKQNQKIICEMSEKYDDIKKAVDILNIDIREIYRKVCKEGGTNDQ